MHLLTGGSAHDEGHARPDAGGNDDLHLHREDVFVFENVHAAFLQQLSFLQQSISGGAGGAVNRRSSRQPASGERQSLQSAYVKYFFAQRSCTRQSANAQRAQDQPTRDTVGDGASQDTASIVRPRCEARAPTCGRDRASSCHTLSLPSCSVHCLSPPRREEAARAIPRRRRRHDRLVLPSHRGEHLRSKQVRSTKKRALSRSL